MYWTLSFLVFSMNWMFPASAVTLSNLPHWEGAIGEVKIMVSGFSLPLASWVNLSELLNCELQFLIYNLENNCTQLLGMLRCLNTKTCCQVYNQHILNECKLLIFIRSNICQMTFRKWEGYYLNQNILYCNLKISFITSYIITNEVTVI